MLINGAPGDKIDIHDRGLTYGDGVFRTLRVRSGQPQHWPRHYRKLQHDCTALNLPCPAAELLEAELRQLAAQQAEGVAKIIITRGRGERGYAPPVAAIPTRILSISSFPDSPETYRIHGIRLRVCDLRLSHQPRLAGVKHLNRLESVLAAAESSDPDVQEGLLLDLEGRVVEGIRSNLFMLRDGILQTPDLSSCGVAGVQRERVMEWAARHAVACVQGLYTLADVLEAEEVFLVNSVIGLWPVRQLQGRTWAHHPVSSRIAEWLENAKEN